MYGLAAFILLTSTTSSADSPLSVDPLERLPAGHFERRQLHSRGLRLYSVSHGQAALKAAGSRFVLLAGQGLEVPPGTPLHCMNESAKPVTLFVMSSPQSHGSRAEVR